MKRVLLKYFERNSIPADMQEEPTPARGRKILFFFPYIPYPPAFGSHVRCLEILDGLVRLQYDVSFLGIRKHFETEEEMQRVRDTIEYFKKKGIKSVEFYQISLPEYLFSVALRIPFLILKQTPPENPLRFFSFRIRSWFRRLQTDIRPDIIWMNYAYWAFLSNRDDEFRPLFIMENHDLTSLNNRMQSAVNNCLSRQIPVKVSDNRVLDENFFTGSDFHADPDELGIVTGFDRIVAISPKEAEIFRQYNKNTPVFHVPVTFSPVNCDNNYQNPPVFPTGPNRFNVQGYYYFTLRVLPYIRKKIPDFSLTITGSCCDIVQPAEGMMLVGFVENLSGIYCDSCFAVCPVLGGTGQQIKIVEAMAHGLPVVATEYSAGTSPIVHGQNGFIAKNAEEFGEYCIKLWENRELCRQMGTAARKTIHDNFSDEILLKQLSEVLGKVSR